MKDENRTKSELIRELKSLRRQVKRSSFAERKKTQTNEALPAEHNLLHTLIDSLPDRIYVKDTESRFLLNNIAHIRHLGAKSQEEVTGKTDFDFRPSEFAASYWADDQNVIQSGEALINREELTVFSSSKTGWHLATKVPLRDPQGKIVGLVGISRDITARKRAEEALFESEMKYRTLVTQSPDGIFIVDLSGNFLSVNKAMCDNLKYTEEEFLSMKIWDIVPQQYMLLHKDRLAAIMKGEKIITNAEYEVIGKDKNDHYIEIRSIPYYKDKEIVGFQGVARDITEKKQAEEALRESEERFRTTLYSIGDGVITTDTNGNIQQMNHIAEILTGWNETEAHGEKIDEIFKIFNEQTNTPAENPVASVLKKGIIIGLANHTVLMARDGTRRPIADSGAPIRNSKGETTGVVLVFNDQTERRSLQDQLFQVQKMDAIGQLAGGVAHDFNNMIEIILLYGSMLEEDLPPTDPSQKKIKAIINTAERSANLTKQLLAFARKQIIAPMPLNLNQELIPLQKMIGRLIGEDIALNISVKKDLWDIKIDPVQLTQILTNLATNARDAIENTGSVRIETVNVRIEETLGHGSKKIPTGEYVQLIFSDTGKGMNKETLSRIFEPFFTTKPKGEGTGLGLSTVFGIVKQNNGFINVYSEPNQGTTFKIYFPRYQGAIETPGERLREIPLTGTETVLIVEDEAEILTLVKIALKKHGYKVLSAQSPSNALAICEKYGDKIDLLITDVVMPEMNGKELKERIEVKYPAIKVLFMSGYPADIVAHRGVLEEGVEFLQKPFTQILLAKKIREVLNR
jgi:PAS domain S-box-containing protein